MMRGIILAQPKTASTSLMATLERYSNFTTGQQMELTLERDVWHKRYAYEIFRRFGLESNRKRFKLRDMLPALDFPLLSKFHSDICDFGFDPDIANEFSAGFNIHKQHFPPTNGNMRLFKGIPKVILTRNIDDTLNSYGRVPNNKVLREIYLRNEAFVLGLKDELVSWQNGWLVVAKDNPEFITIEFEQLTKSVSETLNVVTDHFEIDLSRHEKVELLKERYYR